MAFLLLMPSYNQARYVAAAVQSILGQDDPDWELWIVDNSTDSTPEVMRAFDDPRIRFHHLPERMDPGSCLNWMLERAKGEHFSYVHTDNNLLPAYVRRMREALAGRELGLAYCDMRVIGSQGRPSHLFRRGEFDRPRLLSLDALGVPFAATTALARRLGGFRSDDLADDVFFCASACALAQYVYVREPLLDYRLHGESRTERAGGPPGVQDALLRMTVRLRPVLEAQGLRPVEILAAAIGERLDELDWYFEDVWYRRLARHADAWWEGRPRTDPFFFAGLLALPGIDGPPLPARARGAGSPGPKRSVRIRMRKILDRRKGEIEQLATHARNVLLPWASMSLGAAPGTDQPFRVRALDFRSVWAARQLEVSLGWRPLLDPALAPGPAWPGWATAQGSEPSLDCRPTALPSILRSPA